MGQHDLSYRLFFSHVRMVCDLLREMIGEAWVELVDFASAERVNASFVSEKRKNRESDVIWKFQRRDTGDPAPPGGNDGRDSKAADFRGA